MRQPVAETIRVCGVPALLQTTSCCPLDLPTADSCVPGSVPSSVAHPAAAATSSAPYKEDLSQGPFTTPMDMPSPKVLGLIPVSVGTAELGPN